MKHSSLYLLTALGGAVVGAAIAMLVTPQTGKELRGKIRSTVDGATERMRHHYCDCGCEGGNDDE